MTKPLLIVTACAVLVSLVCFAVAAALGPFTWPGGHPGMMHGPAVDGGGPHVARTLVWTGGDEFEINIPATVIFTQGPASSLEVSGPRGAIDAIELDGGSLRFRQRVRNPGDITVRLTAPDVEQFTLNGAGELHLNKVDQERLEVSVRGAADVTGDGQAREVEIRIAGTGDVDLGAVKAETAEVHIAGAGDATVSPIRRVEVHIAGAGDVTLTTRPPEVESHIAGAGGIKYADPAAGPADKDSI